MRIAIFGAGGVGGYFGGRLAQSGQEVIFIARGEHLRAMQQYGLRVDSILGDFHIHEVQATDDPATVGEVDVVLVATKTWQVPEAAQAMRPMVGARTLVVPLQNGVEAPAQLARVLGPEPVVGGMCRIMSFIAGPGHIKHTGVQPYLAFGELDNRRSPRCERLLEVMNAAEGFQAEIPSDIHVTMWAKFLFIASFSGVGAVTRAPAGVFRSLPETRRMLVRAMEEIVAVAQARGIALEEKHLQAALDFTDSVPESATASMQRDILAGRPSELEAQNGAVVRLGREVGVPTPVHEFLYAALLPQEMAARGKER